MALLGPGPVAAHLDLWGRPDIHNEGSGLARLIHALSHTSAKTGRKIGRRPNNAGFRAVFPLGECHLPERDSQDEVGSPLVLLLDGRQPLDR
eukprot:6725885-Pyramimonas_sp.AAC.1